MTGDVTLGAGREFDLIRRMRERWGSLAVGLGDDAAAVEVPRGDQLLVSTDASLEGVHFRRDWMTLAETGYRSVTAALSDLAAMAAKPLGVLVALETPALSDAEIDELATGVGDAVRQAGTTIRGGNVATSSRLSITTTVMGSSHAPVLRSGARPGDAVYVTGKLGGPASALRAFREGKNPPPGARERFVHPVARLREAQWLAARRATAGIDISDGLGGDALHLAAASACSVEIDLDRVPLMDGAQPEDVWGGEEYELLVTAPESLDVAAFVRSFGSPITLVGRVVAGASTAHFTRGGRRVASPGGYDHLSR
jgi:thiamine-monophosphate kinase